MNILEIVIAGSVLGLAGSLHCVGMCGPIILALPFDSSSWANRLLGNATYFFGKALTYALMGLGIGLIGAAVFPKAWQQGISIASGVLILLMTWIPRWVKSDTSSKWQQSVVSSIGVWMRKKGLFAQFVLGLLNGLLPCGMVYMALAGSISAGGAWESSLFMFVFGWGTMPLLAIISLSKQAFTLRFRNLFNRSLPYVTTVLAILFILRGLSLGIPMLSPNLDHLSEVKTEQVQSCH